MSGSIRLYVAGALAAGTVLPGTPAQAHYLAKVMRRGAGDVVRLFNGTDGEWSARVVTLERGHVTLAVEAPLRPQAAEADLWLAFALLKRDAMDLVVRQATELGVACLLPVRAARSQGDRTNLSRLAAIATEAAEQSERLTVPAVRDVTTLAAMLAAWPAGRPLYACVERLGAPPPPPLTGPAGLLVGPEGGFDPDERSLLLAHPATTAVSLGPLILRAETASAAGLALLQACR